MSPSRTRSQSVSGRRPPTIPINRAQDEEENEGEEYQVEIKRVAISNLIKQIPEKLNDKNFLFYKKKIEALSFQRGWPEELVGVDPGLVKQDKHLARREAWCVLEATISEDQYYIIEDLKQGDAEGA